MMTVSRLMTRSTASRPSCVRRPGLVVVEATGLQIRVALELALARYPNLSDDFPRPSDDVRVIFRPDERPPPHRQGGPLLRGQGHAQDAHVPRVHDGALPRRAFLGSKAPHGAARSRAGARGPRSS